MLIELLCCWRYSREECPPLTPIVFNATKSGHSNTRDPIPKVPSGVHGRRPAVYGSRGKEGYGYFRWALSASWGQAKSLIFLPYIFLYIFEGLLFTVQ
jgi:hypothetical protein